MIKLATTPTGVFSGTVSFAGRAWILRGSFDNSGHWTKVLGRDASGQLVTASLQAGLFGSDRLTGTLSIGATQIPIGAESRPVRRHHEHRAASGPVHVRAPGRGGAAGRQRVRRRHGRPVRPGPRRRAGSAISPLFSSGATVDGSGAWPLYVPLYAGQGYLSGVATFRPQANTDLDGTLHWYKASGAVQYPSGFEGDLGLMGSTYQVTAGAPIVALNSAHAGTVSLSGGEIANAARRRHHLDAENRLTITNRTGAFQMRLAPASGLFSGTVTLPGTTKALPYAGVVLQKANARGRGAARRRGDERCHARAGGAVSWRGRGGSLVSLGAQRLLASGRAGVSPASEGILPDANSSPRLGPGAG